MIDPSGVGHLFRRFRQQPTTRALTCLLMLAWSLLGCGQLFAVDLPAHHDHGVDHHADAGHHHAQEAPLDQHNCCSSSSMVTLTQSTSATDSYSSGDSGSMGWALYSSLRLEAPVSDPRWHCLNAVPPPDYSPPLFLQHCSLLN